jgi:UDP-glucose 4-epimerase
VCYKAFKANKSKYYNISNKNSYSVLEVAKMFKRKIKFLEKRLGERYASALTKISHDNKVIQNYGKIKLKDYINNFINAN